MAVPQKVTVNDRFCLDFPARMCYIEIVVSFSYVLLRRKKYEKDCSPYVGAGDVLYGI